MLTSDAQSSNEVPVSCKCQLAPFNRKIDVQDGETKVSSLAAGYKPAESIWTAGYCVGIK